MSTHTSITMTPGALRSRGFGTLVGAAFGAYWASTGLSFLPAAYATSGHVAIALITGTLLVFAFRMIRHSRRLPSPGNAMQVQQRRTRRMFIAIFAAEIIAMNIAAYLLIGDLARYLMPAIAIIVGLHFYPLASLFRAPWFRITTILMTLAGVAGVVLIANRTPGSLVNAGVAIACAITLWVTSFAFVRATDLTSGADPKQLLSNSRLSR